MQSVAITHVRRVNIKPNRYVNYDQMFMVITQLYMQLTDSMPAGREGKHIRSSNALSVGIRASLLDAVMRSARGQDERGCFDQ
jgi:hypothetical protein